MRVQSIAVGLALVAGWGCRQLPEPDSPGARLYAERCTAGCHEAYHPGTMKPAMWKLMVDRMQIDITRAGQPPLTEGERQVILEYLTRHSG